MKTGFLFAAVFFIGTIAGCGGAEDDRPKTHVVEIRQMTFVPERLEVSAGDSVRWINHDIVSHNVEEERTGGWKSADLQQGESFAVKVAGEGSYRCSLHPVMKGTLVY